VSHDDADSVDGAAVVEGLVALELELALQLHAIKAKRVASASLFSCGAQKERAVDVPDLDSLKRMCRCDGAACCDAAADEGATIVSVLCS
jgi:hypothetical protein